MYYLNEVRCNGSVFRWEPTIIADRYDPEIQKVKFTIVVMKTLRNPRTTVDGKRLEGMQYYWKCMVKNYRSNIPVFETARKLRVNQDVFIRGEFYFARYTSPKDGTLKDYYGIVVKEIDFPHTPDQDGRVQELLKKSLSTHAEKMKHVNPRLDEYGQEVITDGGIGKDKVIADSVSYPDRPADDEIPF
jgi:hypothetical protein